MLTFYISWQRLPCQKILPFLKDYLEAAIIQTAPFAAGFLKIVLDFTKRQNASFRENILGIITNELLGTVSTHKVCFQLKLAKGYLSALRKSWLILICCRHDNCFLQKTVVKFR